MSSPYLLRNGMRRAQTTMGALQTRTFQPPRVLRYPHVYINPKAARTIFTVGTVYLFRERLTKLFEILTGAIESPLLKEVPEPLSNRFNHLGTAFLGLPLLGLVYALTSGATKEEEKKIGKELAPNLFHSTTSTTTSNLSPGKIVPFAKKHAHLNNYAIGQHIPSDVLFTDPNQISFRQSGSQTCYLLSIFGGIINHPEAAKLLNRFKITRTKEGVSVQFPNADLPPIHLKMNEIGHGVKSDNIGIQILEAAYLKIPGTNSIFQQDETISALVHIFGKETNYNLIQIEKRPEPEVDERKNPVMKWYDPTNKKWFDDDDVAKLTKQQKRKLIKKAKSPAPPPQRLGEQGFYYQDRVNVLNHYLQWCKSNPAHQGIFMAIRNDGGHYYSILPHQSENGKIALADPFSMGAKPTQMPIKEFFKNEYKIKGRLLSGPQYTGYSNKTVRTSI